MEGPIFVITILAMCMGFSLIRMVLMPRGEKRPRKSRRCQPELMSYEEQMELQQRAEELMRRVNTLEEIIAAERSHARSGV